LQVGGSTLQLGSDPEVLQTRVRGLINGHFAEAESAEGDRPLIRAGLFGDSNRVGEIASLDVTPIGGAGVGVVGGHVRLLNLEMGLGVLGYDPKPIGRETKEEAQDTDASE